MIKVKNPNQLHIFDPWDFLTPKRRQMLDTGWPGLFREVVLPTIPVSEVFEHFSSSFGRPTKELFSTLGALILQQAFDFTDEETVQQFAFNIQWHYALNISEESDDAKYISPKTLWNSRNIISQNGLEDAIFSAATKKLAEVFKVNVDRQRIDSVHIKSNMRRLGRISIFSTSIHKFLVNLKRHHPDVFDLVDRKLADKYLAKKELDCFSRVKPSESRKTLSETAGDLFDLVRQFRQSDDIAGMYTFKLLERVLEEHCNLTGDPNHPVELKAPKAIPASSLQNPSDPDASYSGHKGQGYQVQVMETFRKGEQDKDDQDQKTPFNLITHVAVEPAHNSDVNALVPAIESSAEKGLKPREVTADALYGSDDNLEKAQGRDVELIAPAMGSTQKEKLSLSDFQISDKGAITACPMGHAPASSRRKKQTSVGFSADHCENCPMLPNCPVKKGKKLFYVRFSEKALRLAKRRAYERTDAFRDRYRWRAGVEATMSEYDRRTGVKHLRVRGLKAVKYSAVLKALAINIFRAAAAGLGGVRPKAPLSTVLTACSLLILAARSLFCDFQRAISIIGPKKARHSGWNRTGSLIAV